MSILLDLTSYYLFKGFSSTLTMDEDCALKTNNALLEFSVNFQRSLKLRLSYGFLQRELDGCPYNESAHT